MTGTQKKRIAAALVLTLAAGLGGYLAGSGAAPAAGAAQEAAVISAVPSDSVRVLYSLDAKRNDRELIALIDAARSHIYFAVYEFTLRDVADALVAAKRRGVEVHGLVDATESAKSYDQPIMQELIAAGIPVETEKHADGNGIMHIKLLVTDSAYAMGSYNWTSSATSENDEVLEIGTSPALVKIYEDLLLRLLAKYAGTDAAAEAAASVYGEQGRTVLRGPYDFVDAPAHIGEYAAVSGPLVDAHTSSSGTVFLDFCKSYKTCPFSAVIFADDAKKFGDLSRYTGRRVTLTGTISSYQGRAEIKLASPEQLAAQ